MTIRRACSALQFDRSTYHYRSRRTDPAFLKKRIKEICETHVRYGYRRVYYILHRECLNAHWFLNLQDACEKLEAWRRHYNEERPHSAIGNIPPIRLANSAGETSPPTLGKAENSRPAWSDVG